MRKTDDVGHVSLVPRLPLVIIPHMTFDLSVFPSGGSKVECRIITLYRESLETRLGHV